MGNADSNTYVILNNENDFFDKPKYVLKLEKYVEKSNKKLDKKWTLKNELRYELLTTCCKLEMEYLNILYKMNYDDTLPKSLIPNFIKKLQNENLYYKWQYKKTGEVYYQTKIDNGTDKMEIADDILVTIPDEDLPKLAEIYKKHEDYLPHAYSLIQTGIEWKRKTDRNLLTFMSPNLCWKEDGTFFALANFNCFDVCAFTLDDTNKNLYEGLKNTKRLKADERNTLLFAISKKSIQTVYRVIEETKAEIKFDIPCYIFTYKKDEAAKFEITLPEDVYLDKLNTTLVPIINELWPHHYPGSDKYLSTLIEMNGGFGLFVKATNELAAWILITPLGQMGMLQTQDKFKRRGYASILIKQASKEIARKGFNAFGTVLENNEASRKMFESNGFTNLGLCNYVGVKFQ